MPKPLEELTYEDVIEDGMFLEQMGRYSRYLVPVEDGDEGEQVVWVNDLTEEIEDPDETDVASDLGEEENDDGNL